MTATSLIPSQPTPPEHVVLSGDVLPGYTNPALAYLESLQPGPGKKTMGYTLRRFARIWVGATIETAPWGELRASDLEWWKGQMRGVDGFKGSSINTYLNALRGTANMAFLMEQMSSDAFLRIKAVKRVSERDKEHCKAPPVEWVTKFIAYAEALDSGGPEDISEAGLKAKRLKAICGLVFGAGLRRKEVVAITAGNVKERRYKIDGDMGKGGVVANLRMTPMAIKLLAPWRVAVKRIAKTRGVDMTDLTLICHIGKGGVLHLKKAMTPNGLNYVFDEAVAAAGLDIEEKYTLHDGRAYFITQIIRLTKDINAARELARQASIATTQIYDSESLDRANEAAAGANMLMEVSV